MLFRCCFLLLLVLKMCVNAQAQSLTYAAGTYLNLPFNNVSRNMGMNENGKASMTPTLGLEFIANYQNENWKNTYLSFGLRTYFTNLSFEYDNPSWSIQSPGTTYYYKGYFSQLNFALPFRIGRIVNFPNGSSLNVYGGVAFGFFQPVTTSLGEGSSSVNSTNAIDNSKYKTELYVGEGLEVFGARANWAFEVGGVLYPFSKWPNLGIAAKMLIDRYENHYYYYNYFVVNDNNRLDFIFQEDFDISYYNLMIGLEYKFVPNNNKRGKYKIRNKTAVPFFKG